MSDGTTDLEFTDLAVTAVMPLASGIVGFALRDPGGADLPAFTPGAHIAVRTPGGAIRRYSLCNPPHQSDRYEIAVKRDAAGRGGSVSMADRLRVGDRLPVAAPRNEFELHPRAKRFLFVAGGIGITPIVAMLRHLVATAGPPFRLHYCTRSRADTAFADALAAPEFAAHVDLHHDGGDPARAFDFWPLLEKPVPGTHVYCCGPRALMDTVRDMSGHWASGTIHFESFGVDADAAPERPAVHGPASRAAARSVEVAADQSILEALRAHGVAVRSSCEAGSCGTCRTPLVAGEAEHRDFVLSDAEHATQIMVCVSRARGAELVLDL